MASNYTMLMGRIPLDNLSYVKFSKNICSKSFLDRIHLIIHSKASVKLGTPRIPGLTPAGLRIITSLLSLPHFIKIKIHCL